MSDYGLDMSGMLTKIQNKFRSGNSVPVDRATISRDEFQFLMDEIERLRTQQGEAVGHIRGYQPDSTVANVYIDSCIDLPPVGTELYLHPPADEAIGVPTSELEKLEESRVALYDFLDTKLNEFEMQDLINITGQIWKVANTKKWQAPADNTVRAPVEDAARYQFLRDVDNWGCDNDSETESRWGDLGELSGAEFDAFVDEAMFKSAQEEG